MNDRWLISSFTASSLIHLALIPAVALIVRSKPIKPSMVPIELVELPRIEEPKKVEVPPPPALKPKNITAPKLRSKRRLKPSPCHHRRAPRKKSKKRRSNRPRRRCRTTGARPAQAGTSAPKQAKPKAAPPAPAIFSAKAPRRWSAAAALKAAVRALATPVSGKAPRATAPAVQAKPCPTPHGRSAAIKSSRAIRSRRAGQACRA